MQNNGRNWLAALALFAIYFIWGTTYLAGAYALAGLKPFTISALRYLSAGVLLCAWLWWKGIGWPERKHLGVLAVSGILMLSGGSGLVIVGEQYIPSGAAAVIMAAEPLFFILLDRARWGTYVRNRYLLAGLAIGFAGLALFTHFSPVADTPVASKPLLGTMITVLSAVCWVAGALYMNSKVPKSKGNLANSAVQLLAAGVFSGSIAGFSGEYQQFSIISVPANAWMGVAYLTVMGSLVAFISFNWLITVKPPAVVSTHTYVNPVIAVLMGWLLAGDQVSSGQLGALALILTGVLITQKKQADRPQV
ncbi:EamA family transporter [Mucilaginibacter pedocola]|uniref:EamA domain-containing protein n=1 Tax=Mucilaginibacter pedocola TaxID=1792845 RepID=A0A1S9PIM3_9SPHI|nr:EamA family transporter [Mucilaginibacter pedocola]OOQ60418.1 hypothetical protein BC343_25740 [Mucilaginibacter pedocola]